MQREQLASRLGFILLSAGCAIGCGNVWKFPWLTGQNGGGAFVLLYILFLIILGLPVLTIEFSLGRAAQKSPVMIYETLAPKSPLRFHGHACLIGSFVLMMFYTIVTGWMLHYCVNSFLGTYSSLDSKAVAEAFGELLGSPTTLVTYTWIVIVAGFTVCSFSLQGGLERVTKWMMLILLFVMILLAINSLTLNGASKGMSFYLVPDFGKITSSTVVAAMNQAFFTLSIGIGSMAIFGSYIGKDRALLGESINVITLDTFVAIMAGVIIFPACFTYGVEPGAGPGLIFVTLPNIFNNMPAGHLWGSLFFVFMTFAAFSTVLAVFETIMACVRDLTGWERPKVAKLCCVAMLFLSLPCALGFNVLSGFEPLGKGTCVLDLEDFIVSNCLLPLGSFCFVLFVTHKCFGYDWQKFLEEANTGKGAKVPNWIRPYCAYVLPVIILVVFVLGIKPFLG